MRARDLLAAALIALTAACAAQDHGEPRNAPPSALDAPASPPPPAAESAVSSVEDELAEYERLLADKESRLRAAGVLLAARASADAVDEARAFDGFAPPPPAPAPAGADAPTSKAKRASKSTTASGSAAAPSAPKVPVGGAHPEREKQGVQYTPRPAADASAEAEPAAERCQTICDLSAATCELEGKICDLASRHADDPRYAALCRRAEDDCRAAAEACQRCSP
jgi:hypothetical protein